MIKYQLWMDFLSLKLIKIEFTVSGKNARYHELIIYFSFNLFIDILIVASDR